LRLVDALTAAGQAMEFANLPVDHTAEAQAVREG
jgi:hypothetical protein